jgi:ribosomal protein S26
VLQANRRSYVQAYLACRLVAETKSVGRLSIRYLVVSEPVSDGSQCPLNRYYKMVKTNLKRNWIWTASAALQCGLLLNSIHISLTTTQKNRDKLIRV